MGEDASAQRELAMTGPWECAVCGRRYVSIGALMKHVNAAHPDASGPPLDPPYNPTTTETP